MKYSRVTIIIISKLTNNMKTIKTIIITLFLPGLLSADIVYVPQDYPSIQAALYTVSSGDTIKVAPGIYDGFIWSGTTLTDIHVFGSGAFGDSSTTLNGVGIYMDDASGWEIADFALTDCYTSIYIEYCTGLNIHHNYMYDLNESHSYAILAEFCDSCIIHHNVIYDIHYVGIRLTGTEDFTIYNNDVLNTAQYHGFLIDDNNYRLQIINNIIAFNSDDGIQFVYGQGDAILDYNDNYGNGNNWNNCSPGIGCISLDPMFTVNPGPPYTIQRSSPCIDTGDPAFPLDPDGTRCDIGAFYYDQRPPSVDDLTISVDGNDVILHWSPFTYVISYNIYRSTEPYFSVIGLTPIGNVTFPEFIDENAVTEGKYFYIVTSVR